MFIDDEREPPEDGNSWVVCRNIHEFIRHIYDNGWPNFISFDHDLGIDRMNAIRANGDMIAKELINMDMYEGGMPDDFSFYVHSQNPIGAENIRARLNGYLKHRNS